MLEKYYNFANIGGDRPSLYLNASMTFKEHWLCCIYISSNKEGISVIIPECAEKERFLISIRGRAALEEFTAFKRPLSQIAGQSK